MSARRADFYADPQLYHVLHLEGTRGEVAALERIAWRHAEGAGRGAALRWLEPASGTGRYLHELAKRGHRGVGVDLSGAMNRFARAEAVRLGVGDRLRFVTARMESFAAGVRAFDVAFNPINSIRHLGSDRGLLEHLSSVGRSLRAGGVYIVGWELLYPGEQQPTEDVWTGRGRGLRVHQFVSYLPDEVGRRRERVLSHLTVRRGRDEEHIDSSYWLRTYTVPQAQRVVARAGWMVEASYGPGGRPKDPWVPGYALRVLRRQT